jgi:superfamily II DNA or RNA helicase
MWIAQGGKCALCGSELTPGWHGDHVTPWSKGGVTDVVNGQALCPTCNLKKGSGDMSGRMAPLEWQEEAIAKFEAHQGMGFLCEATPGAGKTILIAEIVHRLFERREAEACVIVVPTVGLKQQVYKVVAEQAGIELDHAWDGTCSLVRTKYRGAIVTYAWVAMNAGALRLHVSRQPTVGVLDEVHHANHDMSWGKALLEAFEPAVRILLTSGTPFRSDMGRIPFVGYVPFPDGWQAIPDYSLGYGRALNLGYVRSIFFNRHGGTMEWRDETGAQQASFDQNDLDTLAQSRRLRTALDPAGDHLGGILREAVHKLDELRVKDTDAGGLVIAMDQEHAKRIAARMRRELNADPVVVISEAADALRKLRAFADSERRWIVAVRMVSEGVDIPRLRVCVFASNVVTELYFRQAVGRVVRVQRNHQDHTAYFYICDDPRLRDWAQTMTKERIIALREREEQEERAKRERLEGDEPLFLPVSSTFHIAGTDIGTDSLLPNLLAYAEELRRDTPEAAGITREAIAVLLRKAGVQAPSVARPIPDVPRRLLSEELADLRKQNNDLVVAICKRYALEYSLVHGKLNQAVGIAALKACDDTEKLRRRLELADKWLVNGTPAA